MGDNLPTLICDEARNLLFAYAVSRGEKFRQWFYPRLPFSYDVRSDLSGTIEAGMLRGLSAQQIADEIYGQHS
jgi:hypothetical protein